MRHKQQGFGNPMTLCLGVYERCKITDIWITHPSWPCLVPSYSTPTTSWMLNSICVLGNTLNLTPLGILGVISQALASSIWQSLHWAPRFPFCPLPFYSQYCLIMILPSPNQLWPTNSNSVTDHRIEFKLLPRAFDGLGIYLGSVTDWCLPLISLSLSFLTHKWG